jgi:hypothetical protein
MLHYNGQIDLKTDYIFQEAYDPIEKADNEKKIRLEICHVDGNREQWTHSDELDHYSEIQDRVTQELKESRLHVKTINVQERDDNGKWKRLWMAYRSCRV